MEKISLIAWRRREKKFPETEAQRRARAREQGIEGGQCCPDVEALEGLAAVTPFELPEFDAGHFMGEMDVLAALSMDRLRDDADMVDASPATCVSLELTAEQSRTLEVLGPFAKDSEGDVSPALFELRKSQDHRGMILQFMLQAPVIPEMMSLKEVCYQLKVGRRTIMRLVRRGELRSYRVAHRYRFAIEDVKNFLDRLESH
jgi:excisionase family DNA binding protein